jgi:hypothetical protein
MGAAICNRCSGVQRFSIAVLCVTIYNRYFKKAITNRLTQVNCKVSQPDAVLFDL